MNDEEPVIIRDKRKIDPITGQARSAEAPASAERAEPAEESQVPMVEAALLDERTADLQRVQAEYANYRKRTANEGAVGERRGVERLLSALLPVVDDLSRAKEHGDYSGPLQAIGDKLVQTLTMAGLEEFGTEGDPFDPSIHEAVIHDESVEVSVPTATKVLRPGYRLGEKLLRPAMVGVSDPVSPAEAQVEPETQARSETLEPEATDESH